MRFGPFQNKMTQEVLAKRYFLKDDDGRPIEDWPGLCRRVAKAVAMAEDDGIDGERKFWENAFYGMMVQGFFLPNSPTMMNAGLPDGMLSACFVLPIEDSMDGIFKTLSDTAKVQKAGGGTGFNFSPLRPIDAKVGKHGGTSSGVISFVSLYDRAGETIKQGGRRRAANMGMLDIFHPEIVQFIKAKEQDGLLSNFNLSVALTDEFMHCLEDDPDGIAVFQHESIGDCFIRLEDGMWEHPSDGFARDGRHYTYRALFDLICRKAWENGEPGIFFIDTANRGNPAPEMGRIESTNPCGEQPLLPYESCIARGERVLSGRGWIAIESIVPGDMVAVTSGSFGAYAMVDTVKHMGRKEVFKIRTSSGYSVKATADHRFMTPGGWKRLDSFVIGDSITTPSQPFCQPNIVRKRFDEMLGWIHGDGWLTESVVGISFNGVDGDFEIKDDILAEFHSFFGTLDIKPMYDNEDRFQLQTSKESARDALLGLGCKLGKAINRRIPEYLWSASVESQISFLRALFSADGGIYGKAKTQIQLASTSIGLLEDVQILLSGFGIASSIYTTKFNNSSRNPQHRLMVTCINAKKYMDIIGFIVSRKTAGFNHAPLRSYGCDYIDTIESIDSCGVDDVYDISVPGPEHFIVNGLIAHNCNLGSIDVSKLYLQGINSVDFDKLERVTRIAVRFLDNVIDVNCYPIPEIEEMTKALRPIGLGVMGFADLLIKMGIRYGSNESINLAERIMAHIKYAASETSCALGGDRGNCRAIERRNAQLTTAAPTGTLSMMAGCSSGIEPNFAWEYKRRTIDGEYMERHPLYHERVSRGELITDCFITANEVTWEEHIKVQAAFQKDIDAGVSKTVNMPPTATVDDVKNAILMAWKMGCKGLTVYRDQSRAGQVISNAATPSTTDEAKRVDDEVDNFDPAYFETECQRGVIVERPKITRGRTKRYNVACGSLYITVSADPESDDLCEVFVQSSEQGGCAANTKALGILISKALRCGMAPEEVVRSFNKIACPACRGKKGLDGKSCPAVVAKAIIELGPEDLEFEFNGNGKVRSLAARVDVVETVKGSVCPDCGGTNVRRESGCNVCPDCGFSKCG